MQDTWHAFINPAAGNGHSLKRWEALRKELDRLSLPYTFSISTHQGNITERALAAMQEGSRKFISVGGDGTHHELINGILSVSSDTKPTVAILSAGSGNDWARMHHIPKDAAHIAQMLVQPKTVNHSAGLITYAMDGISKHRYFINVAGMALDGRVMEKFPAKLRNYPFLPGYLIAGLQQLAVYKPPIVKIETEAQSFTQACITVHAGICKYSGGGMQFVPHADPTSAQLAITCIPNMSIPRLLLKIPRIYLGTLLTHPKVKGFHCKNISITTPHGEPLPIEADGEFLGYSPISISIIPKAFRLVIS